MCGTFQVWFRRKYCRNSLPLDIALLTLTQMGTPLQIHISGVQWRFILLLFCAAWHSHPLAKMEAMLRACLYYTHGQSQGEGNWTHPTHTLPTKSTDMVQCHKFTSDPSWVAISWRSRDTTDPMESHCLWARASYIETVAANIPDFWKL